MAVDPELVSKDMYPCTVGDLDERLVRNGWTYYVHALRRPGRLGKPPLAPGNDFLGDLLLGALDVFLDWRARNRPWTIGVVRLGFIGSWNDQTPRVIHRETLDGGDPAERVSAVVAAIQAGRFDPRP